MLLCVGKGLWASRLRLWLGRLSIALGVLPLSAVLAEGAEHATWTFRFPQLRSFSPALVLLAESSDGTGVWMPVRPASEPDQTWYFGDRVVLQVSMGVDPSGLPGMAGLKISRTVATDLYLVQTASPSAAVALAELLSSTIGVKSAYPSYRRPVEIEYAYAPAPNDLFFGPQVANVSGQWYLENRNPTNGLPLGVDLNARGAWPYARGGGVTIAIADSGVELDHPDLVDRTTGAPHRNFITGSDDGSPVTRSGLGGAHGTACAGLAAATANNELPMTGMAPEAGLASWVIVDRQGKLTSDERLAEMFMHASEIVSVQNHSWRIPTKKQDGPGLLEDAAIQEAFSNGRAGNGVVMVRAAGNGRESGQNANDDSYANDWRVVCVGAVNSVGRATSYSQPGACLLVTAPGGGGSTSESGLFTTDLKGTDGANFLGFFPPFEYLSSYLFNSLGFVGTSAAAPLVSGLTALLLEVNPKLTVRDVQQILLLSARQFDRLDPDLLSNGVGLLTSHNTGFGIPDAGEAVRWAQRWSNRPPVEIHVIPPQEALVPIPDDGLRVLITGQDIPEGLTSLRTLPSTGPFADVPIGDLPLLPAGPSDGGAVLNLTNSVAVMEFERGKVVQQIEYAARQGASFVMVYNCTIDGTNPCPLRVGLPLASTDYTSIPAVFVGRTNALALLELSRTNPTVRARLQVSSAEFSIPVTNTLSLEHVRLRIQTDHPLRGDLRITLTSPSGTRSILQRLNDDTTPGPVDWIYSSTRHFYEPSRGEWKVAVSDLSPGSVGQVLSCGLILNGVSIPDTDNDGLDDEWERTFLGDLSRGPRDHVARDAYSLVRKYVSGMDPRVESAPFYLDMYRWSENLVRLSWPAGTGDDRLLSGDSLGQLNQVTDPGLAFWESVYFVPLTNRAEFFRVEWP
jgi:subtilisin family serine protease/subtilisin-like proprotein convertase family protein